MRTIALGILFCALNAFAMEEQCPNKALYELYFGPMKKLHALVYGANVSPQTRSWFRHLETDFEKFMETKSRIEWALSMLRPDSAESLKYSVGWGRNSMSYRELAAGLEIEEAESYHRYRVGRDDFKAICRQFPIFEASWPMPEWTRQDGWYAKSLAEIAVPERARVPLLRHGMVTVGQILEKTPSELKRHKTIGDKRAAEIIKRLTAHGLSLRPENTTKD